MKYDVIYTSNGKWKELVVDYTELSISMSIYVSITLKGYYNRLNYRQITSWKIYDLSAK